MQQNNLLLSDSSNNFVDLLYKKTLSNNNFNKDLYNQKKSIEIYTNFLNWLFLTFKISEKEFRMLSLNSLKIKNINLIKVLVTGCGLVEDVEMFCKLSNSNSEIHAQDFSTEFITYAANNTQYEKSFFTISDALNLPYKYNYFDIVFHFGGINLFYNINKAILEMNRVCKVGGTVRFEDESVAEHLRNTDYGKMLIANNSLWSANLPLKELPITAQEINIKYIFGNCFYLIDFKKSNSLPDIDIDVPHKSPRGGSIRSRYSI